MGRARPGARLETVLQVGCNCPKVRPATGACSMHRKPGVSCHVRALAVFLLAVLAVAPGFALSGGATEALRPAVDRVLHILADPALHGAQRTPERRAAIHDIMAGVIDFPDAARRALGVHWQGRTEVERDEFVGLFRELVSYSYIVTMEGYSGQTVAFVGESERDDTVIVLTRMQGRQGPAVPIDYRMHERNGRWLVYDVVVEGVSLVSNYRDQFNSIVRTTSYTELVTRMRARVAELKSGGRRVAFGAARVARPLAGVSR